MLDYRDTGRRYDQCGGGADVERPQAIAARPTSVEDGFSWGFQTDHMRAQDSRRRGQLNSALAFHAERGQKCGDFGFAASTRDDLANRQAHLFFAQVSMGNEPSERIGDRVGGLSCHGNRRSACKAWSCFGAR